MPTSLLLLLLLIVLLQGDPTYLIVNSEGAIENYGLNAVCTHLGCVVPWVGVSTDSFQGRGAGWCICWQREAAQLLLVQEPDLEQPQQEQQAAHGSCSRRAGAQPQRRQEQPAPAACATPAAARRDSRPAAAVSGCCAVVLPAIEGVPCLCSPQQQTHNGLVAQRSSSSSMAAACRSSALWQCGSSTS